ncbi:nuclear transport factor 2 family protein [Microbacterium sp. BK668]|uniref:nuclear transport factor 2 family protein n=1 Tax=Microbacterium sp. BK668 TaxID=2512118 RepID=UPI00105C5AF0|nr:nuclear transport factor 2 family protein [Microbacterium sp. BK668]TDN87737.1 limonene-1,2-epoxide hydrolase [Microbacterium sp. BK668]
MTLSPREFAAAFSSHDFEPTFSQIAEAVVWRMPGAAPIEGRDAMIDACRATVAALAGTEIERNRFFVVDGGDAVVVDTLTVYRDNGEQSTVASCDIYEFENDRLLALTSYNIDL